MTEMPWQVRAALGAAIIMLLAVTLGLSYVVDTDAANRSMIVGGILASATTVVGYYFGSSEGSRKKDETIASLNAKPPGT